MSPHQGDLERLCDLLADRAGGELLGHEEASDLDALLAHHPEVAPASFDRAAAAIQLAFLSRSKEELPDHLRRRLLADADRYVSPDSAPLPPPSPEPASTSGPRLMTGGVLPWLVAAAALVFVFLRLGAEPTEGPVTYEQVSQAEDVLRLPWTATGDPAGPALRGEVTWSPSLQAGFMSFDGLATNDPRRDQYQLWIFDAQRKPEHPVDGGVFDVAGDGARVPIEAKLPVGEATLFAVTVEEPGGVVVSERERIVATAAPQ